MIVAGNAVPNLTGLLPADGHNNGRYLERKQNEPSYHLFRFNKPLRELGNAFYSTFVFDGSIRSQTDISGNNRGDFTKRIFTFIDYSQIESGLVNGNKGVGGLCCIDYIKDWEELGKQEYHAKKEQVASVFISRLEKLIPGIKNVIEYYEVAISAAIRRYTLNQADRLRICTDAIRKIPDLSGLPDNLHIASAGKPGAASVIYGGYLCAMGILRKRPNP
jgi:hypothetical protein